MANVGHGGDHDGFESAGLGDFSEVGGAQVAVLVECDDDGEACGAWPMSGMPLQAFRCAIPGVGRIVLWPNMIPSVESGCDFRLRHHTLGNGFPMFGHVRGQGAISPQVAPSRVHGQCAGEDGCRAPQAESAPDVHW